MDRKYRLPRLWSNRQIRKLAPRFKGNIVNISGWDDRDKEGGYYKNYFTGAASYTITNYSGERGLTNTDNEIFLDLTSDLPEEVIGKFDVCFNHTTLEHIFDVRKSFSNICSMSRDIVFIIVPFSQVQHETGSFKDFWRFTPTCMRYLFKENGLDIIYEEQSPYRNASVYLVVVGSKHPDRWRDVLPSYTPLVEAGSWIGYSLINRIISRIKKIFRFD